MVKPTMFLIQWKNRILDEFIRKYCGSKLFYRTGSYQISFALFEFPYCVWNFLIFYVSQPICITSFSPQYISLLVFIVLWKDDTKGYCQSISSSQFEIELNHFSLFCWFNWNLYSSDINFPTKCWIYILVNVCVETITCVYSNRITKQNIT